MSFQNLFFKLFLVSPVALLLAFPEPMSFAYFKYILQKNLEAIHPVSTTLLVCPDKSDICNQTVLFDLTSYLNLKGKSISFGSIFNAASLKCDMSQVAEIRNSKAPFVVRDVFYKDIAFNFSSFQFACTRSLEITVYAPRTQKKFGLGSIIVIGDQTSVEELSRFRDFIKKDLRSYILLIMLFVLAYSILIRIVSIDKNSTIRVYLSALMATASLGGSGIIETLIPLDWSNTSNLWLTTLASCGLITYGLCYLIQQRNWTFKIISYSVVAFGLLMFFTQNRAQTYIFYFVIMSVGYLAIAIKTGNTKLLIGSGFLIATTINFLGFKFAPSNIILYMFFSYIIVSENHRSFLSFLKINRLLKLSRTRGSELVNRKQTRFRTHALIKLFQRQFKIKRITILNLTDSQLIQLQQYSLVKSQPATSSITELTPVFAHVVTTGNSLINVHSDSPLITSLRRGENKNLSGSGHFTVLPIFSGNETIGAISLTDYNSDQFKTSLNYSTFLFCLDILKGMLVEHLLTSPKTESLNKISKLNQKINFQELTKSETLEDLVISFGNILNTTFGWRIIAATLPTSDKLLNVGKVFSFDPTVEREVLSGRIYAHEENRQGPLALAVNEKKPVIVPNTKWLEGVVHPNTSRFFNVHGTRTAAFIPIIGQNQAVVAVYWIEGIKDSEISYADRELFISFMNTMSERIKLMSSDFHLNASQVSLSQFLPKHLVPDFLAGKSISEIDHGFLMMFDLKGSTRLSHKFGNAHFHEQVMVLKSQLQSALSKEGWILQQFIWDGFEFTYTSNPEKSEKISVNFYYQTVGPIFDEWKEGLLVKFGTSIEIDELSYRICFTYGDTTRGIVVEGATQKWTFTGNSIAVVAKVEQAAKHLPGKIFCDSSILSRSSDPWREIHTTNQGLIIYGYDSKIPDQDKLAA